MRVWLKCLARTLHHYLDAYCLNGKKEINDEMKNRENIEWENSSLSIDQF